MSKGKQQQRGRRYGSLTKTSYGLNRSTNGAFTDQEHFDFLNFVWVDCRSTCVAKATYSVDDEILWVVFKDRHGKLSDPWSYPGVTPDMADAFAAAPSKRGFIWDVFDSQGG